ncbi:MAG: hypothetical protein I8H98_04360 [Moraxellaceae bacterium]|nr:hypothetical protein [Moraxellaceae bacterium]
MSNLSIYRKNNILIVNEILALLNIDLSDTSELERQVLACFAFGVLYETGKEKGFEPAQIHALSIVNLQDSFNYSVEQATDFSGFLIDVASDEKLHKLMNAIIHCGINGYYQLNNRNYIALAENMRNILSEVKG